MLKKIRENFHIRIFAAFAGILAGVIALAFAFWLWHQLKVRTEVRIAETRTIQRELGNAGRYWIMAENKTLLEMLVKNLFTFANVTEISVWDAKGNDILNRQLGSDVALSAPDPESLAKNFKALEETGFFVVERGEKHEVWVPVLMFEKYAGDVGFFDSNLRPPATVVGFARLVRRASPVFTNPAILRTALVCVVFWFVCSVLVCVLLWPAVRRLDWITDNVLGHAAYLKTGHLNIEPIPDDRNDVIGELPKALDSLVEELEKKKNEYLENEELLTEFVENIPEAVALADMNGNMIFANRHIAHFLGFKSKSEMFGRSRNILELLDCHSQDAFRKFWKRSQTNGKELSETFLMNRRDNTFVRAQLKIGFVFQDGRRVRFVVSAKPVQSAGEANSDLMQNMERLFSATISNAFGIIASEISSEANIVTLSIPYVRDMWKEVLAFPEMRHIPEEREITGSSFSEARQSSLESYALLYDAGVRLGKISGRLVKTAGAMSEPIDDIDMNDVIRYAIQFIKWFSPEKTAKLAFSPDRRLPIVRGMRGRLELMMITLLKLVSRSFSDPLNTIYITTAEDITLDVVRVGIRASEFEEENFTGDFESGARGLEFSIIRKIVRDAGGNIEINPKSGERDNVRLSFPHGGKMEMGPLFPVSMTDDNEEEEEYDDGTEWPDEDENSSDIIYM